MSPLRKQMFVKLQSSSSRKKKVAQETPTTKAGSSTSNRVPRHSAPSRATVASGVSKPSVDASTSPELQLNPTHLPSWAEILSYDRMEAELERLRAGQGQAEHSAWIVHEKAGADRSHTAGDAAPFVPLNLREEQAKKNEAKDRKREERKPVCRYWKRGECKSRATCGFAHPAEMSGVDKPQGRRENMSGSWRSGGFDLVTA
ncbi:hypothetical protein BU26DRAFT_590027 [Trematosphaeria pertusa]|uniref:C3H1-type domain-containing protein n=1 Tax=Trematosphaeria pertusa TaxID=390896 RepID=A0A6A6IMF0_9PLEO|nr:uncharacterized protein BU26DRAFT_590027 [Trematosphaeria pertusa]KAF2251744.1 hypothetical protein BU26DRAFT_590027 [Trematosphaeria pertusa]